jgi:hypothetical protein
VNVRKPAKLLIQTAAITVGAAVLGYVLLMTAWMLPAV